MFKCLFIVLFRSHQLMLAHELNTMNHMALQVSSGNMGTLRGVP